MSNIIDLSFLKIKEKRFNSIIDKLNKLSKVYTEKLENNSQLYEFKKDNIKIRPHELCFGYIKDNNFYMRKYLVNRYKK